MVIVLVGGGDVGTYLSKKLSDNGHEVLLIEKDKQVAEQIARLNTFAVMCGDGTDLQVLKNARIDRADTFVSLTSLDEVNIISCQIAKEEFKVKRTVSKVNNPKNLRTFNQLGIDVPIDSTTILSRIIQEEASFNDVMNLLSIKKDDFPIVRVIISEESPAMNKEVKNLVLPTNSVLVCVLRGDDVMVPKGDTQILFGDEIIAVTQIQSETELTDYFFGKSKK